MLSVNHLVPAEPNRSGRATRGSASRLVSVRLAESGAGRFVQYVGTTTPTRNIVTTVTTRP
jgi:hypothetical protein